MFPSTALTPEVQAGQTLLGSSSGYSVLEFIGEGCFGKVAKCRNLATKESVAVKILKQDVDFIPDTEKEVSILEVISVLNPDHNNVVKFFERFEHMGQTCLAFEMLDRSLYDLLCERDWKPLALKQIGIIAKQLLVALDALKGLCILHTDIKPDNIMLVNMQDQPFKIKLIDFGEAIPASKVQLGMWLQPTGFRAPEVALGLPFTEAIDVWGVGCVLACLYLADNLFPVKCDYQMMKRMVEVLGQPDYHLLRPGIYTQYYFIEEEAADRPTWRLMMPEEYEAANHVKAEEWQSFIDLPSSLDDLVNIYPKGEAAEFEDRKAFVDLIKQLLHLDGDQRISPHRALQNPFITKSHVSEHTDSYFTECCTSSRLNTSGTMISVCPMEASADRVNISAASKPDQESDAGFHEINSLTQTNIGMTGLLMKDYLPAMEIQLSGLLMKDYLPAPIMEIQLSGLLMKDYLPAPIMEIQLSGLLMKDYLPAPIMEIQLSGLLMKDLPPCSYYGDPAVWSSDEGLRPCSYYGDPASWSSDEGLPPCSYYGDPAVWSFDEGLPPCSYYGDPAVWSDEGLPPRSYYGYPASWSSDVARPTDYTAAASAFSGCPKQRIKRFFRDFCWRPTVED
ncbi:hypothetical protein VZT92_012917 [Zoarces viviparus]|uniref:Protein kinase domain-containing protein n=1 Tax=Zoarces viviparus TaxID=48416 RepID=A0AAW1F2M9_ZOAVI